MFQIVFNEISAAEISQLSTLEQLELLNEFKVSEEDLEALHENEGNDRFGKLERDGVTLYRFRAKDLRIYFNVDGGNVVIHRVFTANTLADFLYRSDLPTKSEDKALAEIGSFWELIDQGKQANPT
ncbi:MAG: hypothetical protein AAGJ31_15420 [Verrucomicrobiota bacterium]